MSTCMYCAVAPCIIGLFCAKEPDNFQHSTCLQSRAKAQSMKESCTIGLFCSKEPHIQKSPILSYKALLCKRAQRFTALDVLTRTGEKRNSYKNLKL